MASLPNTSSPPLNKLPGRIGLLDKILRYQTTGNRRLIEAIEELERLQAKRKSETASLSLLRSKVGDRTTEPEAST
jgi:hypothetical protein